MFIILGTISSIVSDKSINVSLHTLWIHLPQMRSSSTESGT